MCAIYFRDDDEAMNLITLKGHGVYLQRRLRHAMARTPIDRIVIQLRCHCDASAGICWHYWHVKGPKCLDFGHFSTKALELLGAEVVDFKAH